MLLLRKLLLLHGDLLSLLFNPLLLLLLLLNTLPPFKLRSRLLLPLRVLLLLRRLLPLNVRLLAVSDLDARNPLS